jgi:predicted GNAT family N-acyltransferase
MGEFNYKLVSTGRELESAFEVREQVFVEEQGVSAVEEFDGLDRQALQVVAMDGETVIGTARVRFMTGDQAKLERMAVAKPFRRKGVGRGLMSYLSEELRKRQVKQIVIHAQYEVAEFYKSFGFEESSLPFSEAGIKHVRMQKRL